MSRIMTVIDLPHKPGLTGVVGIMDHGRHARADMVRQFREHARRQKDQAEKVLAATDDAFDVRVVRGSFVQHLVERL